MRTSHTSRLSAVLPAQEPLEAAQLDLHRLSERGAQLHLPPADLHLHNCTSWSWPFFRGCCARLTWSLTPHPPAEEVTHPGTGSRPEATRRARVGVRLAPSRPGPDDRLPE